MILDDILLISNLSSDLYIETIFAIFSLSGNVPVDNDTLETIYNELAISIMTFFIIFDEITSLPLLKLDLSIVTIGY